MPALRISPRADPNYLKAFVDVLTKVARDVGDARAPLTLYVAGGAAMHLYTGVRMSDDIDAAADRKILMPGNTEIIYRDRDGKPRTLNMDANYNDAFSLLHEDARDDSLALDLRELRGLPISVRVLSPLDLAVSKISRFSEIDREDIVTLAKERLVTARDLRRRAAEALASYVGYEDVVTQSIELACKAVSEASRRRTRRK